MAFKFLNIFKKKNKAKDSDLLSFIEALVEGKKMDEYNFEWHEVGAEGNPFNKKILDVRSFTWKIVATTQDKNIAESYGRLRHSNGKEYIGTHVENSQISEISLEYPHNGEHLEGVVFKADSMDVKWDIYIYENIFYFTRSWTGELTYKAYCKILPDKIIIEKIEYPNDISINLAKSNIHFLLKTHAMGQVLPHQVSNDMETNMEIALYSFQQFGNKGCYACFDDITDTTITIKEE